MIIIACVDNNFGIQFNKRRQTKDKEVIDRIYEITKNNRLFTTDFSKNLFEKDKIIICDKVPQDAYADDYFFVESSELCDFSKVDKVILFCWNTVYPCDLKFVLPSNFRVAKSSDFEGNSHKKITEVYYEKV